MSRCWDGTSRFCTILSGDRNRVGVMDISATLAARTRRCRKSLLLKMIEQSDVAKTGGSRSGCSGQLQSRPWRASADIAVPPAGARARRGMVDGQSGQSAEAQSGHGPARGTGSLRDGAGAPAPIRVTAVERELGTRYTVDSACDRTTLPEAPVRLADGIRQSCAVSSVARLARDRTYDADCGCRAARL